MAEQFVCASVLTFTDGNGDECTLLAQGTEAECRRAAGLIPAISYSGDRPGVTGRLVIIPREWWDEWTAQQPNQPTEQSCQTS